MPILSDEDLVAACLEGRESAYSALVTRFSSDLHGVAARRCRDPRDADEAVQEAFRQAFRDLPKWKPTGSLRAWLVTITARTALKIDQRAARTQRRGESLDRPQGDGSPREMAGSDASSDPVAAATSKETVAAIWAAARELSPTYWEVVRYRLEGHTPKEIAELLGIPVATVNTQWARAVKELRKALGGRGPGA